MSRYTLALAALAITAATASATRAQVNRSGLISETSANRYGLSRAWFTQVEIDRTRGQVAFVRQHVNSTVGYSVFEVKYDGGEVSFSERDLNRFGDLIGKEGAKKLAEMRVEDLSRLNLNPKLTTQVLPEITLYAVTDRGVVHAIDAETGRTRWTTAVGSPNHPSVAPGANDEFVAVVNGSNLSVLDRKNGKVIWQRQVRGAPGAGPELSQRYAFVPMISGTIESYQLDDHRQPPWVFQSHGRAVVQPIYTGANIAWPTDRGHLYVCEGNQNNIRYRLETNNTIVSRATRLPPNRLLVASTDGYVYCIHENSGAVQWRFSTGDPVVLSPIVFGDSVLVFTDNNSLFRITAEDGEEIWQVPRIRSFLAASETRLYCMNSARRLTILDGTTGSRLGTLTTETLDLTFVNRETDRVFIGTRSGVIQCLHETGQKWPLIHIGLAEEEEPAKPVRKKTKPADAPEQPDEDPFGGGGAKDDNPFGGDADPFGTGGGGASEDPFGGGSSDDPFGGGGGSSGGGSSSSDPFGGEDPFGGDGQSAAGPF